VTETEPPRNSRPAYRLGEIVARFGGRLLGDPEVELRQVATLESAGPDQASLYTAVRYRRQLDATQAGAIVLPAELAEATARPRIVCDNPYAYFARLSAFLNPPPPVEPGVHPAAAVHPQARVDPSASVGPQASVAAGAVVGAGTVIGPNCSIGERARVGEQCRLHANVSVYHDCVIGDRVILHSGVVIGADGFGLAMEGGRWLKIPQIGRTVIGNDVEVGANTTIDRGAMDDTVIEDGVKLDNQIQIGHNCRIGAHTAIAGCVGIAGSTRIGRHCRIGGSAMIGGHLEIVDWVEISAATAVPKSLLKAGHYSGLFPIALHEDWLRNAAHVRHLDALHQRLKQLEARLAQLETEQSR
jgi:UDP-3-O-[3-hydroxymyristoyl] glucosamine N-acyltransferase